MIKLHSLAPNFSLQDQNSCTHTLSDYRGKKVLIYFYPKDDTPGCTTEACSFRDAYNDLTKAGLIILGIGKDTVKSHKKFADKFELPFPLLADTSTEVAQLYGVWKKKKFMGREYMGVDRMSFLIDEQGNVEKIYESVKPAHHVSEVLQDSTK